MKRLMIGILCLLSLRIAAQEEENSAFIEITAESERKVTPDEIYIFISIEERYEGKDKIEIAPQEEALRKALREKGINTEEFKLWDAISEYQKVKWYGKKDAIASTDYSLMVSKAEDVKIVFEILTELKIEKSRIYKTDYSKKDELKKELRIEAMKKAKEQARYMLEAIGENIGRALIVREGKVNYRHYKSNNYTYEILSAEQMWAAGDVKDRNDDYKQKFKDIEFSVDVYVKFEIAE